MVKSIVALVVLGRVVVRRSSGAHLGRGCGGMGGGSYYGRLVEREAPELGLRSDEESVDKGIRIRLYTFVSPKLSL